MTRISQARISMEDGRVDRAFLRDYGELAVGGSASVNAGSLYTVGLESGNYFNLTLNSATCSLVFLNPFSSGTATTFSLVLNQDSTGGRLVTWPESVIWPGGSAPTLSSVASRFDVFNFTTLNGGAQWFGMVAGQNFSSPTAKQVIITNTAQTSWVVPLDWNSSNNTIEVIAGGAADDANGGGDTYVNGASLAASSLGAESGNGATIQTAATGGSSANGTPTSGGVRNSGGDGGAGNDTGDSGGGGGGAGGPNGVGGTGGNGNGGDTSGGGGGGGGNGGGTNGSNGTTSQGGAGGSNYLGFGGGPQDSSTGAPGSAGGGGAGGGGSSDPGGAGGHGQEWGPFYGSGGGGGGPGDTQGGGDDGGAGGLYGAGGGGGVVGGVGAQGIIVITWTPA